MNSMNIVKRSSIMSGMVIWELYKGANKVHGSHDNIALYN